MLAEYNLRLFLFLPLFFFWPLPTQWCSSFSLCSVKTWHMEEQLTLSLFMAVQKPGKTLHKDMWCFKKKIVTAAERGLGQLINVTFFYIYEQNLMNSCSMTVFILFLMQQPIHTVARVSLRLHRYSGLQLLENVERSLYFVLSRSQQMTWDNLICARNIFHLHFALRKSKSTVNNILSTPIYSAQFHGVLPLTQTGTRSVLNH